MKNKRQELKKEKMNQKRTNKLTQVKLFQQKQDKN